MKRSISQQFRSIVTHGTIAEHVPMWQACSDTKTAGILVWKFLNEQLEKLACLKLGDPSAASPSRNEVDAALPDSMRTVWSVPPSSFLSGLSKPFS